ncbi:Glycine betaine/carnitine transport permease protein GbuB [Metalysinibacillus saudimassiliensis]|uniref:Glycine betaine/carnitine transport permease protein GbuB n=1 Tax=Metalysinibacillus saudimassiliensis TaxID=1461583 RepID=A0A078M164_9BACL|nr:Glycine betaine/carnitine transport permease protein GbuB [Metalysinibacillus saudimassiliensis]
MSNFLDTVPKIPLAEWVDDGMKWLTTTFRPAFDFIKNNGKSLMETTADMLTAIPPIIFILLMVVLAFFAARKKFGLPAFTLVGLLLVYNQGLWPQLMDTFNLILYASILSIIIGVPTGIVMAKSETAEKIIKPILDFMQTMPAFVYLIPAVAFFGIGLVPGVFASIIFALPPTVRMTNLGIRQVPRELVEAADSYGSTGSQKLFKVELPLAKSTIMAGINQTVMLALSMVVTASMIGADGLGRNVLSALQRAQAGTGFVAGISLVILAIILDRLTQSLDRKKQ